MRTFYKQILDRTYEIFGSRQTDNMEPDQITFLLNALENVSSMYAYISEEDQKKIINKRMITDKDYKNINARLIAGWFEQDGKIFFKEVSHEPSKEFEPATEERKEFWLSEWKKVLDKIETNFAAPTKGNGAKLREQLESNGIVKPPQESIALEDACAKTGDYAEPETKNEKDVN